MPLVEIYTSPFCGYCHAAKRLLRQKSIAFEEIDLAAAPERRQEMVERAGGRRTVAQVFVDGLGLGGADELRALDRSGELDRLLGRVGAGAAG